MPHPDHVMSCFSSLSMLLSPQKVGNAGLPNHGLLLTPGEKCVTALGKRSTMLSTTFASAWRVCGGGGKRHTFRCHNSE